jgi:hypothetical protein
MVTILNNTRTVTVPNVVPPDGYILTYSISDGYYTPKPPSLLIIVNAGPSPYNITTEDVVSVPTHSGSFTVNLPTNPPPGKAIYIKDAAGVAAANNIIISSAALIDGSSTYIINTNYGCIKVIYTGVTWLILTKF